MSRICIQLGHVARKTGATGTWREQEFVTRIGSRLGMALAERGHKVHLIGADDPVPNSDVFVALHTDGAENRSRRGASVGYPDDKGRQIAQAWQEAHGRRYPGPWLPANYTPGLRYYYGFRRSRAPYRYLAEHATTTNEQDERWLDEHIDEAVAAHVEAIGRVVGHPVNLEEDSLSALTPDEQRELLQKVRDLHVMVDYAFVPAEGEAPFPGSRGKGELTQHAREVVAKVREIREAVDPDDPEPAA